MDVVYIVTHAHELPDGLEDIKLIGVYVSRESAENAVERTSQKAGFRETTEGFFIQEYQLGKDHWKEGFFIYIPN